VTDEARHDGNLEWLTRTVCRVKLCPGLLSNVCGVLLTEEKLARHIEVELSGQRSRANLQMTSKRGSGMSGGGGGGVGGELTGGNLFVVMEVIFDLELGLQTAYTG